jgi:FkbM family methyltransferase
VHGAAETLQPSDIRAYLATPSEAELELIQVFRRDEALTIFDIGACEGEDSIRYARQFPLARIFAFEPLPENLTLICANFNAYQVSTAEILPQALSDRVGEAEFYVSSGRPTQLFAGEHWNYGNKSSSLLPPVRSEPMYGWIEFNRAIMVTTTTLAKFCADRQIDHIHFIHMDVQGGEHLVLVGAGPMVRNIEAIWLEVSDVELYSGQPLRDEIRRWMTANGFIRCHTISRGMEGDEFYVNLRYPRIWSYVLKRYLHKLKSIARNRAATIKRLMFRTAR